MSYVYLLVGGVDLTGSHLYDLAKGTSQKKLFASQGSGSYAAISVLEALFKLNLMEDECKALVRQALEAGMHGDNASGNSLNLFAIDKHGARFEGPFVSSFCIPGSKVELDYKFKPGTTMVLNKNKKTINYDVVEEAMEVY